MMSQLDYSSLLLVDMIHSPTMRLPLITHNEEEKFFFHENFTEPIFHKTLS